MACSMTAAGVQNNLIPQQLEFLCLGSCSATFCRGFHRRRVHDTFKKPECCAVVGLVHAMELSTYRCCIAHRTPSGRIQFGDAGKENVKEPDLSASSLSRTKQDEAARATSHQSIPQSVSSCQGRHRADCNSEAECDMISFFIGPFYLWKSLSIRFSQRARSFVIGPFCTGTYIESTRDNQFASQRARSSQCQRSARRSHSSFT